MPLPSWLQFLLYSLTTSSGGAIALLLALRFPATAPALSAGGALNRILRAAGIVLLLIGAGLFSFAFILLLGRQNRWF